jgi:hypothetical protein
MTLLELIVAMAILVVVVAITMQVIVLGVNMARNGNQATEGDEAARFAGDAISLQARLSGMGAPAGLTVVANSAVRVVNGILGVNSTSGPDELWVVVPNRNTFGQGCSGSAGTAAVVQKSAIGALRVRCSSTLTFPGLFMVTNLTSGALVKATASTAVSGGGGDDLTFSESGVAGFTNNFKRGGFTKGDLVVPVTILHYYIANYGPLNEPTLMVAQGKVNSAATGFPFVELTGTSAVKQVVQMGVEDMQLQFGVDPNDGDNPTDIVWRNAYPCSGTCFSDASGAFVTGARSVVVTLVSRSTRTLRDSAGSKDMAGLKPMSIADHVISSPVADGKRRVKYERRIELPNAQPWNL